VVQDIDPEVKDELVPAEDLIQMITSRFFIRENMGLIGDRTIHYQKQFKERVSVIIFEGGHEMLTDIALDQIKP
jgi:hypothetical protein